MSKILNIEQIRMKTHLLLRDRKPRGQKSFMQFFWARNLCWRSKLYKLKRESPQVVDAKSTIHIHFTRNLADCLDCSSENWNFYLKLESFGEDSIINQDWVIAVETTQKLQEFSANFWNFMLESLWLEYFWDLVI